MQDRSREEKIDLLPMQKLYQEIVNDLQRQLKKSKPHPEMLSKYGVKKHILQNIEKKPVEIFIYDEKSKPYPFLEDQAEKRCASLMMGIKQLLEEEGRNEDVTLEKIQKTFTTELKAFYKIPLEKPEDFAAQFAAIDHLIDQLMNNLAWVYAQNDPNKNPAPKREYYVQFFEKLQNKVGEVIPDYKKYQILTINKDPEVNRAEYLQRGTRNGEFRDSHSRSKLGLTNFIGSASGFLDENGNIVITSPGDFSHASLPPFDLYKSEPQKAKTVSITTKNMLQLEDEMRAGLAPTEQKPGNLTWINMGVITSLGEKPTRIYEETILAADRLRSRQPTSFLPITFNFGVNFTASKQSTHSNLIMRVITSKIADFTYSDLQKFENQRAFFQLQRKMLTSLTAAVNAAKSIDTTAAAAAEKLVSHYNALKEKLTIFDNIETYLKPYMQHYDNAMQTFELRDTPENREAVLTSEIALYNAKKFAMTFANKAYDAYNAHYLNLQAAIDQELEQFKGKKFGEPLKSTVAVIQDFAQALSLYCTTGINWQHDSNNFKLQARIAVLGDHLEVIDHYYNSQEHTATSFNCVSRNDRSLVLAAMKECINAEHDGQQINPVRQVTSSASNESAKLDTDGGGPKALHREQDPSGHPYREFSRHQAETAAWSTKKLFRKKLKNLPKSYKSSNSLITDLLQKKVDELSLQITSLKGWQQAIKRNSTTNFWKLFKPNSQKINAVTAAYRQWESTKKTDDLIQLKDAIDRWIENKPRSGRMEQEQVNNSRLAAALALQNYVNQRLNEQNQATVIMAPLNPLLNQ